MASCGPRWPRFDSSATDPAGVRPPSYSRLIDSYSPPLYGLDIETDTTINGLDPSVAPVVAVAISGPSGDWVLDGDEAVILAETDRILAEIEPGVIVTWNGANFDLPFLADRARARGVCLGLRLQPAGTPGGHHEPLPGHPGSYRARWYDHGHLDAYQLYRADVGAVVGLPCGLKPLSRHVGLPVVEVDRERIHELSVEEQRAYVASDAQLARALAQRRPAALNAVDQWTASIG